MSEIVKGHVLTLAGPEATDLVRDKSSSGQGDLLTALGRTPAARAERDSHKRRDVDTSHLARFDGTDFCQWFGRRSDGYFYPIGRMLRIVETQNEIGLNEGDLAGIPTWSQLVEYWKSRAETAEIERDRAQASCQMIAARGVRADD